MEKQDISALKKHLSLDKNNITTLYGYYINPEKTVISSFEQPIGTLNDEEIKQYLAKFKKVLSGKEDETMFSLEFSTWQVEGGVEQGLLQDLMRDMCTNRNSREELFSNIANALTFEDNCLILLACNRFDIIVKGSDGEDYADASDSMFSHMICCVCPVKKEKAKLGFDREEDTFHFLMNRWLAGDTILGFSYPAFEDNMSDIYGALFYAKETNENSNSFVKAVFGLDEPPKPVVKEDVGEISPESHMDIVNESNEAIQSDSSPILENTSDESAHDDVDSPDKTVDVGVVEHASRFVDSEAESEAESNGVQDYATSQGNAALDSNVDIAITTSKEAEDRIETRVINGVKYIMIRADAEIEVNGIKVS